MIYSKTKNKCFRFRKPTAAKSLRFPFKSADVCSIFYSGYLDAFSLFWPPQPSLSRSLQSLFSPYRGSPPSKPPFLDLYDSSLLSIGMRGWRQFGSVSCCGLIPLSKPALPLTRACTFHGCLSAPAFHTLPLMDGQKKWVNNSTSSGF